MSMKTKQEIKDYIEKLEADDQTGYLQYYRGKIEALEWVLGG